MIRKTKIARPKPLSDFLINGLCIDGFKRTRDTLWQRSSRVQFELSVPIPLLGISSVFDYTIFRNPQNRWVNIAQVEIYHEKKSEMYSTAALYGGIIVCCTVRNASCASNSNPLGQRWTRLGQQAKGCNERVSWSQLISSTDRPAELMYL